MKSISRRDALRRLATVGVGLTAAACGASTGPATGGSTPAPAGGEPAAPSTAPITLRWDTSDATDVPVMLKMAEVGSKMFAEKFPNVLIKGEPPPEDARQQHLTQMIAGNAPDIIGQCCDTLPFWAEKGQLVKLDDFVQKDISPAQIKDYTPAHWNAFANQRVGRFAMPMYMGTIVLYYSKDAFDKAGVKYPDDTWAWTVDGNGSYEAALKKLSDPTKRQWGGQVGDGMDRVQSKIVGNGGNWVDPSSDVKAAFDQDAALAALQWQYDRLWKDQSLINFAALEKQSSDALISSSRIATFESGDWYLSGMVKTAADKIKWDIAPVPKGPVARNTLATTDGWAIWKGSKNPNEAWEFLKFLQSDEWNDIMITTGFLRPSRLSLFASWEKKVKASVSLLADKNLKAFGQATEFATTLQLFQFHADAQKVISDTRDTTFRKGPDVDVKAAWAAAAKQINDIEAKGSA